MPAPHPIGDDEFGHLVWLAVQRAVVSPATWPPRFLRRLLVAHAARLDKPTVSSLVAFLEDPDRRLGPKWLPVLVALRQRRVDLETTRAQPQGGRRRAKAAG